MDTQPHSTKGWMDKISSSLICNYFYVFFVIFSVWAALSFLAGIWVFATQSKMTFGMLIAVMINIILSFGISATSALFLYLICERALKPAQMARQVQNSSASATRDWEMM